MQHLIPQQLRMGENVIFTLQMRNEWLGSECKQFFRINYDWEGKKALVKYLDPQSPTFLAPGTSFMEDKFPQMGGWRTAL